MPRKKQPLGLSTVVAGILLSAVAYSTDDPVACWSFDEGEGLTAGGCSSDDLDGAISGAAWTQGAVGQALEFDGVDDYVDMAAANYLLESVGGLREGTISVWFRFDSAPAEDDIHSIFYLGTGAGASEQSCLLIEVGHYRDNRRLYVTHYENGSVLLCFDTGFHLEVGRWYHLAAVVGQTFNTGYLDGQEIVGRNYNFGLPTDRRFFSDVAVKEVCWVGRGLQGCCDRDYYFHGAIDELRIYDRALDGEEIRRYYESARGGAPISFRRADPNADGSVDISDAVAFLIYQFRGGPDLPCLKAADMDDSGGLEVTDAVYLLDWLFRGGQPPPEPLGECGYDRTADGLACRSFEPCR